MTILAFTFVIEPTEVSESVAEHMVALVRSDGWDLPLRYFSSIARPGEKLVRRPGMLRPKVLASELAAALLAAQTSVAIMSTSARNDSTYADCWFETDAEHWSSSRVHQLQAYGQRPLGAEPTWNSWLEAVLAFADGARASMGIVCVMDESSTRELSVLMGTSPGDDAHPLYGQWSRLSRNRREVGERYVRFPRWGTLYSHRHVAAIGGVAKIREVVAPAVVRELSAGVYFQVTDSIASARLPESVEKQRAFEALVEPWLPPPREEERYA
ncbi:MAG: hypothetical protein KIT31_37805 [Deltaproteobacteria bacterium]|nr:hypothetical protein [Deltaproteobacteria bacterium]